MGSAIKRRVEAVVFHPFHVNPADKEAWNAGKYDGDTVAGPYAGHFNGLVEAGGVQAAQAFANLPRVQGSTRLLRQLAGQGFQQICAYAIESDTHHLQAGPVEQ